jgi:N-terminal half of MaoC dehydratase
VELTMDRLAPHIGGEHRLRWIARDPVNLPLIRQWCDVMGEDNAVYTDEEFALRSVHRGLVAPPAMLDVWDSPGLMKAARIDQEQPSSQVRLILADRGFTNPLAVTWNYRFDRYLRPGELVASYERVEHITAEKQTRLGRGYFVTIGYEYRVGAERVGTLQGQSFVYQPDPSLAASSDGVARVTGTPPSQLTPFGTFGAAPLSIGGVDLTARGPRTGPTRTAADVAAGDVLPQTAIPISTTLIVGGALFTLDYADAHHDRDNAGSGHGVLDIFTNIRTTLGLCQRWISDWAGPEALWRSLSVRLGRQNYAYDTMVLSGSVRSASGDGQPVTIDFTGTNQFGNHVVGQAELELPAQRRARETGGAQ